MNQIITIMPDFGNAPYAWIKEEGGPESDDFVGICIADGILGFEEKFKISDSLTKAFSEWAWDFEKLSEEMDWEKFEIRSICLAHRLFAELNGEYTVRYARPMEDLYHDFGLAVVFKKCSGHLWRVTWPLDPEEYTCENCGIKTLK